MPRRIDAQQRTADIAAASLRLVEREGLAAMSVRGVAAEAGIAAASLRRAFPTQLALREYCLDLIQSRVTARIAALNLTGRERVVEMLAQLLPLDRERRTELVAQVQLGLLAVTDATLSPAAARLSEAVGRACELGIATLAESGDLHISRDVAFEALRLRAVLDGLAMQAVWSGQSSPPASLRDVLVGHLDELATPATTSDVTANPSPNKTAPLM